MPRLKDRTVSLSSQVQAQRDWIDAHGGSRAGYVAYYWRRYDACDASAIYEADVKELKELQAKYLAEVRRA